MLVINADISLPDTDIGIQAIRAQGAGGQHVNKVSSSVHLRFDIHASSLPENWKTRLLQYADHRITAEGVIVLKAQRFRSLELNKQDARARLRELILMATKPAKRRRPTRQTRAAKERRLTGKLKRGAVKALRSKKVVD